jgi:glutaredoxin
VRRASRWSLVLALVVATSTPACRGNVEVTGSIGSDLPELTLRDETPDLLLTWIDDKGETHVAMRPGDVPPAFRDLVRVVVSDREDGTRDLFYVADLTHKEADGSYKTRTMRRRDWERMIEQRRGKPAAGAPPQPAPTEAPRAGAGDAPRPGQGQPTVIIYGADWCKPCHQAAAHLTQKGVAFVEKDIEANADARQEMMAKLQKIGRGAGSIPVIDVRGEILIGYSPSRLDDALAKSAGGTML